MKSWITYWDDGDLVAWLKESYVVFLKQPELFVKKYSELLAHIKYDGHDLGQWMLAYHESVQSNLYRKPLRPAFKKNALNEHRKNS